MELVDVAVENEKAFCETLPELKFQLGSNIGCFISSLRNIEFKD